jgi:hypothetical protein
MLPTECIDTCVSELPPKLMWNYLQEKNHLLQPRMKPRLLGRPARILIILQTEASSCIWITLYSTDHALWN